MAAIEMELIAHMLHMGDLSPIHQGKFREDHCLTNEGKNLHQFLRGYRHVSNGAASVPTRAAILTRFTNFELPEPNPNDDINSIIHEVHIEYARSALRQYAADVHEMAESVDPLSEMVLAQQRLEEIAQETATEEEYGFDTHLDLILERYYDGQLLPFGIPWPWPSLQESTRGMQKGEFIIISGRPKTRKTFIALATMVHAFVTFGTRVLIFTPEMHPFMILLRCAALAAGLRYSQFKKNELDPFEEYSLLETVEAYGKLDTNQFIRVDEYGNDIHPEDMEEVEAISLAKDARPHAGSLFKVIKSTNKPVSFIQTKIRQYRPHAVLCDSFYRQAPDNQKKSDSDVKAQTYISRELKNIAAEEEIAMLGTHQINRVANAKIGDLSNLAYADAFGQDADAVLRAITEKREGTFDVTALVMLGARETEIDGVFIKNVPCSDFSEIGPITDLNKVKRMLKKEEEEEAAEEEGKKSATDQDLSDVEKVAKNMDKAEAKKHAARARRKKDNVREGRKKMTKGFARYRKPSGA